MRRGRLFSRYNTARLMKREKPGGASLIARTAFQRTTRKPTGKLEVDRFNFFEL